MYHFEGVRSWVDVALQVLKKAGWPPECAVAEAIDVLRLIPLEECVEMMFFEKEAKREQGGEAQQKQRGRVKLQHLTANVIVALQDKAALAICVSKKGGLPIYRSVIVHGTVATLETPDYLEEMAAAHAIRVVREWVQEAGVGRPRLAPPVVSVGTRRVPRKIGRWLEGGTLDLHSGAAAPLVCELQVVPIWVPERICMHSFYIPAERISEDMPWRAQELLMAAEEFGAAVVH